MTCIVGVTLNNKVYIGGDSAGVGGYDLVHRKDEKVFMNRDFLFGFTSSFRMGQLLRYAFSPPPIKENQDVYAYMVTDFIDAVRHCMASGGYMRRENGVEEGGHFLVGYKGRLFHIEGDFQVGEYSEGYASVGCGSSYAMGSMFSTEGMEPEKRIEIALTAAEKFSAGVCGPNIIMNI